jgi:hypothetical protein
LLEINLAFCHAIPANVTATRETTRLPSLLPFPSVCQTSSFASWDLKAVLK